MAKAFEDFLKPQLLLVPGLAGIITMVIADTLWIRLLLPPRWTALALSLAFGSVILTVVRIPPVQRVIYYLYNSCVIFLVAVGSNRVGQILTAQAAPPGHVMLAPTANWTKAVQDRVLQRLDMSARDRTSGADRQRPAGARQPVQGESTDLNALPAHAEPRGIMTGLKRESINGNPVSSLKNSRGQAAGSTSPVKPGGQSGFFANW